MIRILIVDDHVLFREGLAGIIRAETDIEVVGFAGLRWSHILGTALTRSSKAKVRPRSYFDTFEYFLKL